MTFNLSPLALHHWGAVGGSNFDNHSKVSAANPDLGVSGVVFWVLGGALGAPGVYGGSPRKNA